MPQPHRFRLVLHRFGVQGRSADPVDITDYVKQVNIGLALVSPWESVSLLLVMPRPMQFFFGAGRVVAPNTGNWLVIYDDAYHGDNFGRDPLGPRAIFWGYITTRRGKISAQPGGKIVSSPLPITAVGWFDFLGRVRVQKAPGGQTVGTLLAPGSWDEIFKALADTAQVSETTPGGETRRRDIGASLDKLLEVVGAVDLPPSLGGSDTVEKVVPDRGNIDRGVSDATLMAQGFTKVVTRKARLGDRISVVHDADTRDNYAPNLPVDPVPGWTIRGLQAYGQSRATAQQLIMGTFGGDANMIEIFPSLEEPGAVDPPAAPRGVLWQRTESTDTSPALDESIRRSESRVGKLTFGALKSLAPEKSPKEGTAGGGVGKVDKKIAPKFANSTAKALGANPVLVYRMRPWRDVELSEHVQHRDVVARTLSPLDLDDDVFQGITWRGNRGSIRSYQASDGIEIDWLQDDAQHVNTVTVGLPTQPDSEIKWLGRSGLPLVSPQLVRRKGLRVYEPDWPFFPPLQDDDTGFMASIATVAAQASQFMGAADRFSAGTISMRYDGTLRPGMCIDIDLPLIDAGIVFRAYVERVDHTIAAGEKGTITARTKVTYSRGLFGEAAGSRGGQIEGDE